MTQRDRDRLVALKKAKKGVITQRQAAEEIGQSERHVRRLLKELRIKGDKVIMHALRGRRSNRKVDERVRRMALEILGRKVYAGFGPTLAAEYLGKKHGIHAGRETVRTCPPSLPDGDRVRRAPQGGGGPQETRGIPKGSTAEKSVDEKLPSDPSRQGRSLHHPSHFSTSKAHRVGRAKTARPSSRLIDPKTAARGIHQSRLAQKNQNPQNGQLMARFDWGFGAFCFGAIPVAAVFGSAPGSATSPEHRIQLKPTPHARPSKQDISTWQGLGHFYLALTAAELSRQSGELPLGKVGQSRKFQVRAPTY